MEYSTLTKGPVAYSEAAIEDRSAPRIRLDIPAVLRPSGVTGFGVRVINLSLSGFACEATTGMPKGARCWLCLFQRAQPVDPRRDIETVRAGFAGGLTSNKRSSKYVVTPHLMRGPAVTEIAAKAGPRVKHGVKTWFL